MKDFLQLSPKQKLVGVFVLVILATSTVEIAAEFLAGQPLLAMWDDMLWVLLSMAFLAYFLHERKLDQRELARLQEKLDNARGKLRKVDARSDNIANQYRAVMQKQFDAWQLSASEQDVVIGMLKGLTFREIAGLRNTREKTVRQQASAVYRKAGVSSRNELTAWFFEDLLDPPADPSGTPAGPDIVTTTPGS